jgi:phosphoserine/homoserine phosphotransferase
LDRQSVSCKTDEVKQSVVTLDLEGVLTPEIWIAVAEKTGIRELRLNLLDQHGLKLPDIQKVIASLRPLEGAREFLAELRALTQVIILSDTFEEFAQPLMKQLDWPTLFCHKLEVENGRIVNYRLRLPNQKQKSVAAFKNLNYKVIAAGDSFNDTAMLVEADTGIFFRAPLPIQQQFPQFKAVESYEDLMRLIREALKQPRDAD